MSPWILATFVFVYTTFISVFWLFLTQSSLKATKALAEARKKQCEALKEQLAFEVDHRLVFERAIHSAHGTHGPDDCLCRGTSHQALCVLAGCDFCIAGTQGVTTEQGLDS